MTTEQTHCASCSEKLAGDEAPAGGGQPLICGLCNEALTAQRRGKWKPVMQWESSLDGFRLASRAPVPWKSPQVALIRVARGGEATTARTLTGDLRARPRVVGVATQHRVFAALREFCNFEVRKTRRLAFNPAYAVELEAEITPEAKRWSAAQAAAFLAASADDPLGLLFRIIILRGARRAEAVGFRWSGADLDAGYIQVERPILLIGADVTEGRPKSSAGERKIWLDAETVRLLREHRTAQLRARMQAGRAWQDDDLIFCQDDGTPWRPDYVTRRFQAIAKAAGLPVIKLHEGRHSAASLARDAAVDPEIRRKTLGHADDAMTSHYTHIEAQAHLAAAEAVAQLVGKAGQG